ncbi:MAG: hypothetical protein SNJ78_11030, partial [Spirochaetales bacterium]
MTKVRQISIGGDSFLGIALAQGKGVQAFLRMLGSAERKGFLVGESSIEEWEVRGFTELEGDLYLYGALFKELPFPLLDLLKSPPVTTFPP